MKLPVQVEALIYRRPADESLSRQMGKLGVELLALHRVPEKGGFWQPLTGGLEDYDADEQSAVVREIGEELSLTPGQILDVDPLGYEFKFQDDKGVTLTERAYGVEVAPDAEIILSDEHDDMRWDDPEAVRQLFKWDDNRFALDALMQKLSKD